MQVNLLKSVIENIAGKPARDIVDFLVEKKDVNEFLIAKKLKLTINQARNILYKLSDSGLVSFTRKKDKRKGWYIYFWTLDTVKSLELLEKNLIEEINQLENQLRNRKTKRFYFCRTCNVEIKEENALTNQFTCPECGQVYELSDSAKFVEKLETDIAKLQRSLETIIKEKQEEIEKMGRRKPRQKPGKKSRKARKKAKRRAKKLWKKKPAKKHKKKILRKKKK